jgi:hypothetical protein
MPPASYPAHRPRGSLDDLSSIPLERIETEITELAGHINAATCRRLCLVAELDRREGWASWGAKSCAHWLSWRCSVSPNAAREQVRVARRLVELPAIREAFASGELSFSKVRALTRVATEETEDELVGIALHATAAQLEVMVRSYRRASRAQELDEANARHASRALVHHYDEEGFLVIKARLAPEDGAVVLAALTAAAEQIACSAASEGVTAVTPEAHPLRSATRNADALVAIADAFLVSAPARSTDGGRHQVVVHVDVDELRDDGRCELDDGTALPPETARRLGCDGSVVMIEERDGEPLSVGRKTRKIPYAIRRALRARDKRCRFPGCSQTRFVDAHHIRHWANGGETSLGNLVQLCRFHHRFVHEGGCRLEKTTEGELVFTLPVGTRILDSPEIATTHPDELRRVNQRLGLLIEEDTCVPRWAGEAMDYDIAVGWLMSAAAEAV